MRSTGEGQRGTDEFPPRNHFSPIDMLVKLCAKTKTARAARFASYNARNSPPAQKPGPLPLPECDMRKQSPGNPPLRQAQPNSRAPIQIPANSIALRYTKDGGYSGKARLRSTRDRSLRPHQK